MVTVEKKNTDPLHIFSIIWLGGVVILAVYALGSCLKIWRRVKLSIRTTENIYICDRIDSPFIFGIIKPRIYLPSRMNEEQKESVIAHERAHLKRLDHFWKPFGFGLLLVYWFNPLCWLAYILFCRDIELACDEKVIKDMDAKQKKIYSKVLLSFSESEKHVLACPLAFGEVGVKERIKSILNYKKPTFWIIAVAVISILVTSVLFLTNPQNNTYEITFHIPAECEGALVFADEEISPKGKTVSFLVGQDVGDTAIQLKGVEVKEENAYDEPVYATPGMPAKMEVEKGAWFQVGIYASNDTAEEKTVHVTVKDVEVRIAADKDTTAEIAPLQDIIEVSVPTIDLSATTGADGSTMYMNYILVLIKFGKERAMSLIEDAKNKNPDAFEQLIQPQLQRMYRVAISMLHNEEDAADAIQETVLKCWQKIGQLKSEEYFGTWLTRILINQCKDILKERKKVVPIEEFPELIHEDHYFTNEWRKILSNLNGKYQIVMELYYVDGFSTKEIARMLHITEVNVRSRMVRGRKQLEQILTARAMD